MSGNNAHPSAPAGGEDRPRAIVAEPDDKIRALTGEILRRENFAVTPCKAGDELLDLCKQQSPAVVFVDVTMPGTDVTQLVRILQRCRETQAVRIVGVCTAELDQLRRDSLKSDGIFAIVERPMKRADIIANAGAALASSNEERAKLNAATAKRPPRARTVASDPNLLARRVLCPFHEEPVAFDRFVLRTGKVASEPNFFDLPVYPATGGASYHALATIVCPTCLFATSHPAYFTDGTDAAASAYAFPEVARRAIQNGAAERFHQIGADAASMSLPEKSLGQAIAAGELSIVCSQALLTASESSFANEFARIGNARLRIGHLKEQLGHDAAEIDAQYRSALQAFDRAYSTMRGSTIFRGAYQAMALAIHLGEDRTAYAYLHCLNQLENDPSVSPEERTAIRRYLPRCQRAWEDREYHRSTASKIAVSEAA